MEAIIHYVEDLQFACFAFVFSIMALQSRRDRTIRFVCCSYLLATLVSVIDVTLPHPYSPLTNAGILTVLSLRYAVLAAGLVYFTRNSEWASKISFVLAGVALLLTGLSFTALAGPRQLAIYYFVLAWQQALLVVVVMRSSESSTRIPRVLLAFLFLLSVGYRLNQLHFVLSAKTAHDIWLRNLGLFVNGTVLSGVLPFTVVWMMNARDHANLLQQSLLDPLTGLLNRRGLNEAADRELKRYSRSQQEFALAVADIDHFKKLNDQHGHAFGDEVLVDFSVICQTELRSYDVSARSGGEEFMLLFPLTSLDAATTVLERIRKRFEANTPLGSDPNTVSIGVTSTRGRSGVTWAQLQKEADKAMYQAKHLGRNQTIVYDAASETAL
ncbi:sensor domain-containing diguanylate cyclase [Terriglobus roseus]|uniref:diguanylate cyclase n=1 Tax=Terriglobus roseus TaxID=392734 RepID=A0A1G7L812_9BACT|nr:GGDEF domain-containing protein [Terriglobus roseus]SDF45657.1 diguanylate cyclase (GGDEF) domain-containing protein [Terriglobus roseus]